jgi:hypothetical protein
MAKYGILEYSAYSSSDALTSFPPTNYRIVVNNRE